MEFREAFLCVFVLLLSGAAAQNQTLRLNEQKTTGHQSNWTGRSGPARSPVSYRLKVHEIWNPAVRKHKPIQDSAEQGFQIQQRWEEARELTSEQLEQWEDIQVKKFLTLIRGPDLNPPLAQETKVEVKFEKRVPVPAESVAVRCGEGEVTVEVKQNFLGNAQLIRPGDLTLGGCAAVDFSDHVVTFQTELQRCNGTRTMTEDALVYAFSLIYSPTPIENTFILKTNHAKVGIQCHYLRKHYASSGALRPTWTAFASNAIAKQHLRFTLRLMTEDWQAQRASSVYFLSDVMHIEAAVLQGHHVPLRVYVDSCVATVTPDPDPDSELSYPFIQNHGCLSDAKLTGAKSYFMQRSQEDKLHFQLKAFRFHQDHRNSLYITCRLKATPVSFPVDLQHKACSYLTEANRWVASGGDNKVCDCCESSCSLRRRRRSLAAGDGTGSGVERWEGMAALGPIVLEENILEVKLLPEVAPHAASSPSPALLCGVGLALAVVLLLLSGAVVCSRRRKPTEHAVCT